jgi:hypothetical protein
MKPRLTDENIFKVVDPDEWYCKVINFPYEQTNLRIEARHPDNKVMFIVFRNVVYFSGWMSWKGLSFRIAEQQEFLQFVHFNTSSYQGISDEELLSPYKLGIFQLFVGTGDKNVQIKLIANTAWSQDHSGQTLTEIL